MENCNNCEYTQRQKESLKKGDGEMPSDTKHMESLQNVFKGETRKDGMDLIEKFRKKIEEAN
jgi:hypothetical protein